MDRIPAEASLGKPRLGACARSLSEGALLHVEEPNQTNAINAAIRLLGAVAWRAWRDGDRAEVERLLHRIEVLVALRVRIHAGGVA